MPFTQFFNQTSVVINGNRINGGKRLQILVDGRDVTPQDAQEITVNVEGNLESLEVTFCKQITVTGNVGKVSSTSAPVKIGGNVTGDVETVSGEVDCKGSIRGNVETLSGDITYRKDPK